jgi:hypothetical protein
MSGRGRGSHPVLPLEYENVDGPRSNVTEHPIPSSVADTATRRAKNPFEAPGAPTWPSSLAPSAGLPSSVPRFHASTHIDVSAPLANPGMSVHAVLRNATHASDAITTTRPIPRMLWACRDPVKRSRADRPRPGNRFRSVSRGYPCPCCGFLKLPAPPGSDEICPVCFWQDDPVDNQGTHVLGPNRVRLSQARQNYVDFGAAEERLVAVVRAPLADERPEHSPDR